MNWGIVVPFGGLMVALIGEIYRSHMLIRRLEKRVGALEQASNQHHQSPKRRDIS